MAAPNKSLERTFARANVRCTNDPRGGQKPLSSGPLGGPRYTTKDSERAWCSLTVLQTRRQAMPKYVIERDIPGAGKLSAEELKAISQKSCGVLSNMGP